MMWMIYDFWPTEQCYTCGPVEAESLTALQATSNAVNPE